jgi:hypothetical protein
MAAGRAGRSRTRLRALVGAAVLVGATTMATIGLTPPAGAATGCDLNRVAGQTVNKTKVKFVLNRFRLNTTNVWCNVPEKNLSPGENDTWRAGDNLFNTELKLSYEAPNGDLVTLNAASLAFQGAQASCSVIANGRNPSPYRCEARRHSNVTPEGSNEAQVIFVIDDKK